MSLFVVAAYYYFYSEQPASEGGNPTLIFGRIIFHTLNPDTAPLKLISAGYLHKWSKTVRSFYERVEAWNKKRLAEKTGRLANYPIGETSPTRMTCLSNHCQKTAPIKIIFKTGICRRCSIYWGPFVTKTNYTNVLNTFNTWIRFIKINNKNEFLWTKVRMRWVSLSEF